jgi:hypothetical protein
VIFYVAMFLLVSFEIVLIGVAISYGQGYLMLIYTFGFLSPSTCLNWALLLIFLITGWRAIFLSDRSYHATAKRYRVWCRVSRFFAVSWFISSATFVFNCYMFANGMSISGSINDNLDSLANERNTRFWYEREIRSFGNVLDFVAYSNPSMTLKFPIDYYVFNGRWMGVSIVMILILPFSYIYSCLWAQSKYYRWRFFPNIKVPID